MIETPGYDAVWSRGLMMFNGVYHGLPTVPERRSTPLLVDDCKQLILTNSGDYHNALLENIGNNNKAVKKG